MIAVGAHAGQAHDVNAPKGHCETRQENFGQCASLFDVLRLQRPAPLNLAIRRAARLPDRQTVRIVDGRKKKFIAQSKPPTKLYFY